MARIYPSIPPDDTTSFAETQLRELLLEQLNNDYIIFHSARWMTRESARAVQEYEADFLIVHPAYGVLILEVKGGNIEIDGDTGQWTSNQTPIKDPVVQSKRTMRGLREKLRTLPWWSQHEPPITCAIALPDVEVSSNFVPHMLPELVLDRRALKTLAVWVPRAIRAWSGDTLVERIDDEGVKQLIDLLSPKRNARVPLVREMEGEDHRLVELTQDQYKVLNVLRSQHRLAIDGCAGSGKTMLAVEQARYLAAEGLQVLLVCFNKTLASSLKTMAELRGVDVYYFHGLCEVMAGRAGIGWDRPAGMEDREYFDDFLNNVLFDAASTLGPQYDAVVVDEGQDLLDQWWLALESLLRDEPGFLSIFYDDNQNLYGRASKLPEGMSTFRLQENCRNTKTIHAAVASFYPTPNHLLSHGPKGRPVELIGYDEATEGVKHLGAVLHDLTVNQRISEEQIVVLTQRKLERTAIGKAGKFGNLTLTEQWPPAPGQIFATTIYQFKGLESPIVVVAEISESANQNLDVLLYVACSRARNHLVLIAQREVYQGLAKRLT